MEIARATVLGVLQGLTEFLPVSSSGHLRLIQEGLGWSGFGLAYDTLLHVATLLAVIAYFRHDLAAMARAALSRDAASAPDRRLAWLVVAATVPTGLIGLVGGDWFESAPLSWVGASFLVTAAALVSAELLSSRDVHDAAGLAWGRALLIGVAQGIAIMPGISRSGATMAAGLGVGLDRRQAARFSFLLSGPVILLAAGRQTLDLVGGADSLPSPPAVVAGFVAAAVTGYLAIAGLMSLVRSRPLYPFALYTALLGVTVVVWQVAG